MIGYGWNSFLLAFARRRYCVASFIFIVAGLNLALGYLLALYLAPEYCLRVLSPAFAPGIGGPVAAERAAVEQEPVPSAAEALLEPAAPTEKTELAGELIEEFKDDLIRYREQLATLNQRMRAGNDIEDPTAMQTCLADLFAANARYLE